jgi:hypothetical protein
MNHIVRADTVVDFDPIYISFTNNAVYYPNENRYLYILSGMCTVLHFTDTEVWLIVDSVTLCNLIRSVDVQFIEHRSDDNASYLRLVDTVSPSLKIAAGNSDLLKVRLRSNTEIYGDLVCGDTINAVLSVNYNKHGIIWSAMKIKCADNESAVLVSSSSNLDFLQECQLEEKLINI